MSSKIDLISKIIDIFESHRLKIIPANLGLLYFILKKQLLKANAIVALGYKFFKGVQGNEESCDALLVEKEDRENSNV